MRRKMIEQDLVECVIGLGPNLFYNSPMEACLLITKTTKEVSKKGKILIINAVKEVRQDKNIAFLENQHIERIYQAYKAIQDQEGFCKAVSIEDVLKHNASLNMSLYVSNVAANQEQATLEEALQKWQDSSLQLSKSMQQMFETLK